MKPPYKEGEPSFTHFLTILKIILDLFLLYLLILYFLITWRSRLFDFLKANVSGFREKILSRLITRKNLQRNKSYCIALKKFEPQSLTQKNSRTWNNSPTHPYPPPSELKWSVLSTPFYPIKLWRFIVLNFTWDISMSHDIANNDYAKFRAA